MTMRRRPSEHPEFSPLLEVQRTQGYDCLRLVLTRMTQSGHEPDRNPALQHPPAASTRVLPLRSEARETVRNETARVHRVRRLRGSDVAAGGTRAAGLQSSGCPSFLGPA